MRRRELLLGASAALGAAPWMGSIGCKRRGSAEHGGEIGASRIAQADELMTTFTERAPPRYLWTDAFAVCNFLGLHRATGEARHLERALQLVDRVHHELGRHRADDPRRGWISGLASDQGEAHPTRGGLRIGKRLPERTATEPFDEAREWDRDGQYFHYLTKWIHALDQTARATADARYDSWARELAETAYRAFTYAPSPGSARRMYWKMSIDLSRPLVTSMGQHDPLDGLVTCLQLGLDDTAAGFAAMVDPDQLATDDPLGTGGLLDDAARLAQLGSRGAATHPPGLLDAVLDAALAGVQRWADGPVRGLAAGDRLAFRELGLAIGLAGLDLIGDRGSRVAALARYAWVRDEIESFWLRPEHREVDTWHEHADIDDVMLATCLVPDGFLVLVPRR